MDAVAWDLGLIPCETRIVDGVDFRDREAGSAEFAFWMRAEELDAPLEMHQALLAFASDLTPIGTGLRPIAGLSPADNDRLIQTATTSHTMWFHDRIDLNDWVGFQQVSPMTGGGRSFCWGHCFDRSGVLVASYAQDSMIRWYVPRS
jgi:acyl-CoA thioesterase-2